MNDELRASYDAIPYLHGGIYHSHPARIGAIARLMGREAAPPDACRVLELGCAIGGNLLPLAAQFPGSEFVGVDFSPEQIRIAERACAAAGITNARFVCADLRGDQPERFDYVIAHGVYSWVPAEVREMLPAVCKSALAPGGIAYISYNTHPAWGLIGGLREVILAELAHISDHAARAARAERVLGVLERAFAAQGGAYSAVMRELLGEIRAKPVCLAMHDELELTNTPVTFLDFVAHAGRHGLHFLSEAHYASMPFEHLPAKAREALAELQPDAAHAQQFLDLLGNRRFRASLLTGTPADPARPLDAAAIRECAIATHLRPESLHIDLAPGTAMRVVGRHGVKFEVRDPAQKAFLGVLMAAAPGRVPFPVLLEKTSALLAQERNPVSVDPDLLCHAVARLFTIDQADVVLTGRGDWIERETDAATALQRHCAGANCPRSNRWLEPLA